VTAIFTFFADVIIFSMELPTCHEFFFQIYHRKPPGDGTSDVPFNQTGDIREITNIKKQHITYLLLYITVHVYLLHLWQQHIPGEKVISVKLLEDKSCYRANL
jgi:hypothetical protein